MKILLADDHALIRDTLAAYCEGEADIELVTTEDLPSALAAEAEKGPFDVVLLDYAMPGMAGLTGFLRMKAQTDAPVGVMSGAASRRIAEDALARGAAGFVPKTMGARGLLHALRLMAAGGVFLPPGNGFGGGRRVQDGPIGQLTERERDVLDGLCRGLANKEIARDLGLQEVTVKLHVRNLCRKVEARNRTQAALIARDAGLC